MKLTPADALYWIYLDLRATARTLKPWCFAQIDGWMQACTDLLAACPDKDQRMSWATLLAGELKLTIGLHYQLVAGELLSRAAQIKPAETAEEAWLRGQLEKI